MSGRRRGLLLATAVGFVAATAAVEVVSVRLSVVWGMLGAAALLIWAVSRAGQGAWTGTADGGLSTASIRVRETRWYLVLALVPLARVVSFAMPLDGRSLPARYALVALPLLAAAVLAVRAAGYDRRDVGLWLNRSPRGIPLDLVVAVAGINVGYVAYRLWTPAPVVDSLAPSPRVAVLVGLLMLSAMAEELVFRGLIQRAVADLLGTPLAVVVGAALFAAFQVGHRSPAAVGFAFVVAVIFGSAAATTRSLLGVTLAHGIANVCLLVVFPLRS